jgi:hypothetical protein
LQHQFIVSNMTDVKKEPADNEENVPEKEVVGANSARCGRVMI